MRHFLILFFFVVFLQACLQPKTHAEGTKVFRISDRQMITFEQMLNDVKNVDIVIVGEVHNNPSHHRLQLEVIKGLHRKKVPLAVGFEMFIAKNQHILDRWTAGEISQDDFIKAYYANWQFPWPYYSDIFLYLRENRIPAVALNVSPEITRKISASGFASLNKEELLELPPETGCLVNEKYMQFIRRAYSMHGHDGKKFLFFCEAQLIWDQVMARNLIQYLKNNPGKKVVTIAGNGHAWKRGIPEHFSNFSEKTSYSVILPHIPGHLEPQSITSEDADYIFLQ